MGRYILKRLAMLIPVILGVIFVVFFIMDLAPGSPVNQMVGENATEEEIQAVIEEYGLDDPLLVRYGRYVWDLLHGDLGRSYTTKQPVLELYMQKLGATAQLAVASIILAMIFSLPLGIYAAVKQNKWQDGACMVISLLGLSIPNFWLGLMLIILFALHLGWFPASGNRELISIVLPAFTEGTGLMAFMTRTTRSSMLETIRADYVRTARAKGVAERTVIWKHAMKNGLLPVVTLLGSSFGAQIGGAIVTENLYNLPGLGTLTLLSINMRDTPTVVATSVIFATLYNIILILVDLMYAFIDPRIKAKYSR